MLHLPTQQFQTSEWWCQKVGAARPGLSPSPRACFKMVGLDLSTGSSCDKQPASSSQHLTVCMKTRSEYRLEELGPDAALPSSQVTPVLYETLSGGECWPGFMPGQHFHKTLLIYGDCIGFLLNGKVLVKPFCMNCYLVCLELWNNSFLQRSCNNGITLGAQDLWSRTWRCLLRVPNMHILAGS